MRWVTEFVPSDDESPLAPMRYRVWRTDEPRCSCSFDITHEEMTAHRRGFNSIVRARTESSKRMVAQEIQRRRQEDQLDKQLGAAIFTTIRLALPDGQFEDVHVVSSEAVLRVLRNPCVRKLRDGEPFFVLRGQDSTASDCVLWWCDRNSSTLEDEKRREAHRIAVDMINWPGKRRPT